MTSNNNDLISRSAVIRAIRNHINVNRERADRGYAAMIREEDIEIIEGVPGIGEARGEYLLRTVYNLLKKQDECPFVLNILEEIITYDGSECDGYCLMEDIKDYLEMES